MTETTIGKDQAIALLQKLSTDDDFRARYETAPSEALEAAGIPAELIRSLPIEVLTPTRLNSKEAFSAALKQVRDDLASVYLCQRPPHVQLKEEDASNARGSSGSMSFAAS